MSYIRCWSNPDGLYIYESSNGIEVHHTVKPPLASKYDPNYRSVMTIPTKAFKKACYMWTDWHTKVKIGDLTIEETHIYTKTGKLVHPDGKSINDSRPTDFKIKLQYKNRFVYLWIVTWEYVVKHVVAQEAYFKRKKIK